MNIDDETSDLGQGSNARVVKADYTNPATKISSKVAVKVFLSKAGCSDIDIDMA